MEAKRFQKTALLLDGARRVEKSYVAEEFAKRNYKSYILIDFNRAEEEVKDLFNHNLTHLEDFFMYLSAYYGVTLYPRESIIIFDEVQLFPRARSAIKYLVADGRYDYLETGSLMSIQDNTKDILIPFEERHIKMYPMDFEEFCWAMEENNLLDVIKTNFEKKVPMGPTLHRKAMTLFRQYLIVGEMPQVVKAYKDHKNFDEADRIKKRYIKSL